MNSYNFNNFSDKKIKKQKNKNEDNIADAYSPNIS